MGMQSCQWCQYDQCCTFMKNPNSDSFWTLHSTIVALTFAYSPIAFDLWQVSAWTFTCSFIFRWLTLVVWTRDRPGEEFMNSLAGAGAGITIVTQTLKVTDSLKIILPNINTGRLTPFFVVWKESWFFYRQQTMFAKVMFLQVSVCPQREVLPHCMLGYTLGADTLLREQTPSSGSRHPPPGADTPHPQEQTPPRSRPLPGTVHAGRYGQQAGGMHPTGMQSCLIMKILFDLREVWHDWFK